VAIPDKDPDSNLWGLLNIIPRGTDEKIFENQIMNIIPREKLELVANN